MKITVLLMENAKQIMLTPENDYEKGALKMIAPDDEIKAVSKWGTFQNKDRTYGYEVSECEGGYYRRWESESSLMFIVSSLTEDETKKESKPS